MLGRHWFLFNSACIFILLATVLLSCVIISLHFFVLIFGAQPSVKRGNGAKVRRRGGGSRERDFFMQGDCDEGGDDGVEGGAVEAELCVLSGLSDGGPP